MKQGWIFHLGKVKGEKSKAITPVARGVQIDLHYVTMHY